MTTNTNTQNLNIQSNEALLTPADLLNDLPLSNNAQQAITESRQVLQNIIDGKDSRPFVVVGPCSIHDTKAAFDYAQKLKKLADAVSDELYLVMRVYFEKPRTTTGLMPVLIGKLLNGLFVKRQSN